MSLSIRPDPQFLDWSLPVVHDCLREFYHDLPLPAEDARVAITERHFTLWTSLILGDFGHLQADLRLLAIQARSLRINFLTCCAADRHVAAEIFDIGLRRFRRMPHEARANGAALLALLKRLQSEEAVYTAPSPIPWAA